VRMHENKNDKFNLQPSTLGQAKRHTCKARKLGERLETMKLKRI
jgi:hypothetical protein